MKIEFCPVGVDSGDTLIEVDGDVIFVDGVKFDFGPLNEGDILPDSAVTPKVFVGDVSRKDGVINLTVLLPHGRNAPFERRFPKPILVTKGGRVELPAYDEEEVANDD